MFGKLHIYTAHIRPDEARAAEKPVFVREGFNFSAFLFTWAWALYRGLWLVAAGVFIADMLLTAALRGHIFTPISVIILEIGLNVLVGFLANDWVRARLARRGYILADITAADTLLRAEQRYFERYLAGAAA